MAELHSIRAGEAEKAHMMEILQRLHQQELGGSSDEEGGEGGSDRGACSHCCCMRISAGMSRQLSGLCDVDKE